MRVLEKAIAHSVYALGLLLMVLLPQNEYAWMQEMDPTIDAQSIVTSGNVSVSIVVMGAIAVLAQIFLVVRYSERNARILSGVLIGLAVLVVTVKVV